MKKINLTPYLIFSGVFLISFIDSISSNFYFRGHLSEPIATFYTGNQSPSPSSAPIHLSTLGQKKTFNTFISELEEIEEKEKEGNNQDGAYLYHLKHLKDYHSNFPSYISSSFLTFIQPKKYLLFHTLKLDC
ncbi:MAG: hypothetical protein R2828_24835 [Saprospiraceae bacterium]